MYEKAFKLEIVTPDRVVFQGDATSLSAPGVSGGFQVLYDHAPLLASIETGTIKVKDASGKDTTYATSGGFVEVKHNTVVVLADTAERTDEIDVERAKAAQERASKRLQAHIADLDEARARAALARALNRLRLAGRT
ncbi:MAG: F0F1 ATP synthase subunit epsilon [Bacteroidota bacterium]